MDVTEKVNAEIFVALAALVGSSNLGELFEWVAPEIDESLKDKILGLLSATYRNHVDDPTAHLQLIILSIQFGRVIERVVQEETHEAAEV